ncbi:hypothetical protein BLOT_010482, partial [Blomia tropicalis]
MEKFQVKFVYLIGCLAYGNIASHLATNHISTAFWNGGGVGGQTYDDDDHHHHHHHQRLWPIERFPNECRHIC